MLHYSNKQGLKRIRGAKAKVHEKDRIKKRKENRDRMEQKGTTKEECSVECYLS